MQKQSGFTLVELLVVTAIIIVIVAIAVPNLMRSRMHANETSALGSIRRIATAETAFKAATLFDSDQNGEGDYGTLSQLANPDGNGFSAPFIDNVLGGGTKGGYTFTVAVTLGDLINRPSFTCVATPTAPGRSGFRQYYADDSGPIRYTADGSAAGPASPIL